MTQVINNQFVYLACSNATIVTLKFENELGNFKVQNSILPGIKPDTGILYIAASGNDQNLNEFLFGTEKEGLQFRQVSGTGA